MNHLITAIIIALLSIFSVACVKSNNDRKTRIPSQKQTGELIPVNFADSNYIGLAPINDTITNDGWTIKYLVKDDSTRYHDIYIKCSKGGITGIFTGSDLLDFRSYFIPAYAGENDSFIYFIHGCASYCAALLVFSKDSTAKFQDFERIVDYNINFNQVLYITDSCYEFEDKLYDLALVDLDNNNTQKITYNNICSGVYKPACIDTVIFSESQITIKTTLRKNIESEEEIKETRTIKL